MERSTEAGFNGNTNRSVSIKDSLEDLATMSKGTRPVDLQASSVAAHIIFTGISI
jgi:hypothetical protein